MKRIISLFSLAAIMVSACNGPIEQVTDESVVFLPEGATVLHDAEFGIYYGDRNQDGTGVISLVLSDAHCYQEGLGKPYMDSEGDMLVLSFRTPLIEDGKAINIPAGDYPVSAEPALKTVDASASYVTRLVGSMQSTWALESGSVNVAMAEDGEYTIVSSLVIAKGEQKDSVEYVCVSPLTLADYMDVAPGMVSLEDDIINMPFADVECIYNGDLFGNGTGNFLVNMITKGFVNENAEVMDVPGVYITLNFFSRLYSGNSDPVLEGGTSSCRALPLRLAAELRVPFPYRPRRNGSWQSCRVPMERLGILPSSDSAFRRLRHTCSVVPIAQLRGNGIRIFVVPRQ